MNSDAIQWLARWKGIASRDGVTLTPDGDGWRLDPLPASGKSTEPQLTSISDDVLRLSDGRVITRRMTREDVEAFFGPSDGAI